MTPHLPHTQPADNAAAQPDWSLAGALRAAAGQSPLAPAWRYHGERLNFAELWQQVEQQAGEPAAAMPVTLTPITGDAATRLGQSPLRAPSVFNFFRPGYLPPNSALAARGLQAPEFQLVHESSVVAWVNFAQQFVAAGVADVKADYARELPLATDAQALVAQVDLLLAAGALSTTARQLITQAVQSMPAQTPAQQRLRVQAAVHLVLCSPDYLVAV